MSARKLHRNQPPIDVVGRSSESRTAWLGVVLACFSVGIILAGALTLRRVDVGEVQQGYSEYELNQAFTTGGLRKPEDQQAREPEPAEPAPLQKKEQQKQDDFCPT